MMPRFIKDFRLEDLSIDHKDRLGQGAGGIVFRGNYANVPIAVKSLRIDSREKRHQLVRIRGLKPRWHRAAAPVEVAKDDPTPRGTSRNL